jgi:hypothetical protein
MGNAAEHEPVVLTLTAFSRYTEALEWVEEIAIKEYGDLLHQSPVVDFDFTSYYTAQMGKGLKLKLLAFKKLIDPRQLPAIKHLTNDLEKRFAKESNHDEERPLNLDPGYLTPAKFLLATTKDASHRIYLDQGMFAEVTLYYMHGAWHDWPWTYPNYKQPEYKEFLQHCREYLMGQRALGYINYS